jgi:hypothetical protein
LFPCFLTRGGIAAIDPGASFEARLSGGSGTTPQKDQYDSRSQRNATHDRIEHDRVRPRDVDFEEPGVRHALRGEERETWNCQGDEAQDYQNQPDHYERSHLQAPFLVE